MSRILIVDDDDSIRTVYKAVLSNAGFEVLSAKGGAEGLRVAAEKTPDLILLDVMMPGKGGTEVSEELAHDPATKDIPVIFLTGLITDKERREDAGQCYGRCYLSKSTDKSVLLAKIKELLAAGEK